jgi:hypothetical protein
MNFAQRNIVRCSLHNSNVSRTIGLQPTVIDDIARLAAFSFDAVTSAPVAARAGSLRWHSLRGAVFFG